jgi:predicted fused transcriptional regulator/phosphomethylpyrimidine kinase
MLGQIGSKWLDRLHQQLAKALRVKGWSQMDIAKATGSTQSTVSRQIMKPLLPLGASADETTVDGWAQEMAHALDQFGPGASVQRQRLVFEFQFSGNQTIRFDKTLTGLNLDADQAKGALLRRLDWSTGRLDLRRLSAYMPAVGMNVAACLPNATTTAEVAAYPGRMTLVDNVLRRHETPELGASQHLANVLLQAKAVDSEKCAILNLKPPTLDGLVDQGDINYISDELDYKLGLAPKGKLQPHSGRLDIILDEGAFGWEPSLYILAPNPMDLIDRTHAIIDAMNTE